MVKYQQGKTSFGLGKKASLIKQTEEIHGHTHTYSLTLAHTETHSTEYVYRNSSVFIHPLSSDIPNKSHCP